MSSLRSGDTELEGRELTDKLPVRSGVVRTGAIPALGVTGLTPISVTDDL